MKPTINYFKIAVSLCFMAWLLIACQPEQASSSIAVTPATAVPRVIYVTPSTIPSAIPTVQVQTPTATPTVAPTATHTPDLEVLEAQCQMTLLQRYTDASDLCLGEATGYLCNGGAIQMAEPEGRIANSLANMGALIEAAEIDMVQTKPLLSPEGGGLLWMRFTDATAMNGLLVGDVTVRDVTPNDAGFDPWLSFTLETRDSAVACDEAPHSTLIAQGPYGQTSRFVVNGTSVDLNGTIAIQTVDNQTVFIALEGRSRLTVFGTSRIFYAGEQISVPYEAGNWSRPQAVPNQATPLNYDRIHDLPITLLDRAILLPQPGNVRTVGRVNMRAEPNIESRLLYQVPVDEPVSILGENTEQTWYHVRLGNGETGWMRNDLVVGSLGEVAVAYDETPLPPQRYGASSGANAVVAAAQGGNLRQAPDVSFRVLNTLGAGTEVELLARSPYSPWVKVNVGGTVGWMALITLETDSIVQFLPIDYDVPLPAGPTATPVFEFGGGHAYPDPSGGQ